MKRMTSHHGSVSLKVGPCLRQEKYDGFKTGSGDVSWSEPVATKRVTSCQENLRTGSAHPVIFFVGRRVLVGRDSRKSNVYGICLLASLHGPAAKF
ncbi:hypothetical protein AVEN_237636-1 [Araneus ventricosus]|uniref:Uncharacterized protein n=1 Tax=Araneus ventricosus TaxID=182803 RepID=A0A4Y2VDN3_ARAVE|nr:hypothetical protein AVEN_237636-1 [Araneus ventricosus]